MSISAENTLRLDLQGLIEYIRDGGSESGGWNVEPQGGKYFEDEIRIGLARFQSYRGRTTAALIEELIDFVTFTGAHSLYYHTLDDVVILSSGS